MNLQQYFSETEGIGILSTADVNGEVNGAVYAKPHFLEDGCLSFIMQDKLTHHNLLSNPYAAYVFVERNAGFQGIRLYLVKKEEVQDDALIDSISRRTKDKAADQAVSRFLVTFTVEKVLKLVGDTELSVH